MSNSPFQPIQHPRLRWQNNVPVSDTHDDPYFSLAGGREETQHVFLQGNQMEQRITDLADGDTLRVAETGFGTGLNFFETWHLFERLAPAHARLHYVATEALPMTLADLQRSHGAWPEHQHRSAALQRQWPHATPGFHTLFFDGGRLTLTLMLGDSTAMLAQLDGWVDAWFLDGFAPSRNDSMWHDALYREMARLSHEQTTVATYSAAGHVRRGLTAVGFAMHKRPGFAGKRHMSSGRFHGGFSRPQPTARKHVVVVGAGLAGCTCAAALAQRGHQVTLLDPDGVAGHGSGNHAGIVYSTPSAHITPQNRFYLGSFLHALGWLRRYGFPACDQHGRLNGLVQLPGSARHRDKAVAALAAGFWPNTLLQPAPEAPAGSYQLMDAGFLKPRQWCEHLLSHHAIACTQARVTGLQEHAHGVTLTLHDGTSLDAEAVVLATANAVTDLWPVEVALRSIRGQVTLVRATEQSAQLTQPLCHSGYWTPALDQLHCVGASFNLHDHNPQPDPADDADNLAELRSHAPHLWHAMGGEACSIAGSRVAFRCQSPDFLPLAGALSRHVWCSVAHGSRGITGTPLCADLIAASICDELPPVDRQLAAALSPHRFRERRLRRLGGPSHTPEDSP